MSTAVVTSMDISPPLPRLPFELREMIWKWATPDFGIVVVELHAGKIRDANTRPPHPLMHACRESRTIFRSRFPHILMLEGSTKHVPVNFAHDLFFVRGFEEWRTQMLPCPPPLSQFQNIITSRSVLTANFPPQNAFWYLENLQQLWICLHEQPEQFHRASVTDLRRHCNLHHCDILTSTYVALALLQASQGRSEREICPACQWSMDIFGEPNLSFGNFRLVFDTALPVRPTEHQILASKQSAVAWVRVSEERHDLNSPEIDEQDEWERQAKDAKACVMKGIFNCSH